MVSFITSAELPKSWTENRPIGVTGSATPPGSPIVREASGGTMYEYLESGALTLGQLVNAICCRLGSVLEDVAVTKGNVLMRNSEQLNALSEIVENVAGNIEREQAKQTPISYDAVITSAAAGSYCGKTYREFLSGTLGLAIDGQILPTQLVTYAELTKFYNGVKQQIDSLTTKNQQDLVNLQICLSRRDVAYSTARSSVRMFGKVSQEMGQNMQ